MGGRMERSDDCKTQAGAYEDSDGKRVSGQHRSGEIESCADQPDFGTCHTRVRAGDSSPGVQLFGIGIG